LIEVYKVVVLEAVAVMYAIVVIRRCGNEVVEVVGVVDAAVDVVGAVGVVGEG
jgi:hypothetical protein